MENVPTARPPSGYLLFPFSGGRPAFSRIFSTEFFSAFTGLALLLLPPVSRFDSHDPSDWPLCVFYSAALSHLLALVGVNGEVRVHTCQGIGDQTCVIGVNVAPEQK